MRRLTVGLGLGLAALALATPAQAGTVARSGTTVIYQAAVGEGNLLQVRFFDGSVSISDRYDVAPGAGCATDPLDGTTACPASGVTRLVLRLGDLNDELKSVGPALQVDLPAGMKLVVDGGTGKDNLIGTKRNDELTGGSGADKLFGSGGKDKLKGGSGNDRLTGFGRLDGGSGNDFLEAFYGFAGEKKPYPSTILGGPGNDHVLTGNKVRDVANCGPGRDVGTTTDRRGVDRFKSC
jgi:serralysin